MLFQRVIYSIRGFLAHYSSFKLFKNLEKINSIFDLDPANMQAEGIKILVLDFDGVLASHGEFEPSLEAQDWLKQAVKFYKLGQIFILTNNPKIEREDFFKANFPEIEFIYAPRKKPYPDGLLAIQSKTKALPYEIALVDDRLLTGMLACQIFGAKGFWVIQPYANFAKRPVIEAGFAFLRMIEKLILI
jgi:predicted HAD superfamily phosphohydrolase YqeG